MAGLQNTLNQPQLYRDEHLFIDFPQQAAVLDSQRMTLTRKEYDLLALLVRHAGEIVPREALLMRVWGYGSEIRTRTLDVHIRRLRQNLEPHGKVYIETVFATGYRFQPFVRKRTEPTALAAGSAEPLRAIM